jgi:hypothetical protein
MSIWMTGCNRHKTNMINPLYNLTNTLNRFMNHVHVHPSINTISFGWLCCKDTKQYDKSPTPPNLKKVMWNCDGPLCTFIPCWCRGRVGGRGGLGVVHLLDHNDRTRNLNDKVTLDCKLDIEYAMTNFLAHLWSFNTTTGLLTTTTTTVNCNGGNTM